MIEQLLEGAWQLSDILLVSLQVHVLL